MPLPVSYMGTKRQLAATVGEIVADCPPGSFLDLFSGMCAVATVVAPQRAIQTNDYQHFAQTVSYAHFCSQTPPPLRFDVAAKISGAYTEHCRGHFALAADRISREEQALKAERSEALTTLYEEWDATGPLPPKNNLRPRDATLFRDTFAGSYFGIIQAIEIDAIRYSIDILLSNGSINADSHRWLLLGLCVALSKCSTSTGHFAQPLTPNASNLNRFTLQRRKSIRAHWLSAIEQLQPVGTPEWRTGNKAHKGEAIAYLDSLTQNNEDCPTVIYADPPYTNDQYSRYYHLYETLILYDFPQATGKGRYRPDRAVSSFSLAKEVLGSVQALISKSASLGCDLILSYPTNGLLVDSRNIIPEVMKSAYGRDAEIFEIEHSHSTMGASKGAGKQAVTEVIYRARH